VRIGRKEREKEHEKQACGGSIFEKCERNIHRPEMQV